MTDLTCKLIRVENLMSELDFTLESPIRLYCDNQDVIHIIENIVLYEHTKHTEVDCYVVHQKVVED